MVTGPLPPPVPPPPPPVPPPPVPPPPPPVPPPPLPPVPPPPPPPVFPHASAAVHVALDCTQARWLAFIRALQPASQSGGRAPQSDCTLSQTASHSSAGPGQPRQIIERTNNRR